ncbi:hypothetical protein RCS94_01920 [Orbaceae bacterium ac157xtp]
MKINKNEFEELLSLNNSTSSTEIEKFVIGKSNLPGPRANLTFASEFAKYFQKKDVPDTLWQLVIQWAHISANETQNNSPKEYLPFCAIQALGAHFEFTDQQDQLIDILKEAMNDPRWRIKESVAIAFQLIGEHNFNVLEKYFNNWITTANLLEQRAILAALAHPPILKNNDNAKFALKIADDIMLNTINISSQRRRSEEFKVLKKGLNYCLSVFVSALPKEGFLFLEKYAGTDDPDIISIIKSNLSKGRLKNKYPLNVLKIYENISEKTPMNFSKSQE